MIPIDARAEQALALFAFDEVKPIVRTVVLRQYETLLIDNWRTLHGRQAVLTDGVDRQLARRLLS